MLILDRFVGGEIVIQYPDGQEVRILLMELVRNRARIGITAPAGVVVDREEVAHRRRREGIRKRPRRAAALG